MFIKKLNFNFFNFFKIIVDFAGRENERFLRYEKSCNKKEEEKSGVYKLKKN